jgi:hypothetical protein
MNVRGAKKYFWRSFDGKSLTIRKEHDVMI